MNPAKVIDPKEILNLFTEDIKTNSIHERLFTAGNMWLVAAALGPEKTRGDLIPFLMKENHFEGEIKAIIAEQLGDFVKYVGGPQHASVLINPLRNLIDSEEIFVREKAIDSLASVCSCIPGSSRDTTITNLISTLFQAPFTTSRIAGCSLLPKLYEMVTDQNKAKLRRGFITCTKDDTPIVRRAALHAIPALCNVLKQTVILGEIIRQALAERLNDDDESIRVMIPECLPAVAAKIPNAERYSVLVPLARSLAKDSSWWVRANMAKTLSVLVPYFAADLIGSDIGSIILFLLRDFDPEVKTAACGCCKQIVDVLVKVPTFFNDSVLPEIISLSEDKFKQVREEVAADILVFARITGDALAREKLFPILCNLIYDHERDVVIAALKSLRANFTSIDSYAITHAVLPKLIEIATKEDFRVKIEIIHLLDLFLPYVTPEAIPKQIIPLIRQWMKDSFFAVREEICKSLPSIITVINNPEVTDMILEVLVSLIYDPTFSIRQAALLAAFYMADVLTPEENSKKILPSVLLMASDRIPNVKILCAKVLQKLKTCVNEKGISQINLCFKLLKKDTDSDVIYFASL
ncbi:HEAT repeat family protein [Tritrichomonas foetus]|uniref:HEAT repeat family protein n=1 Tax=Tritrichomonas foetus TaxID=1144522 RepID=A0A1J4KKX2_9EUKA|nr:HEAT repeat family protein [Tritrichomonas foetus]|eukprot:OHT11584.1 HEAT repeat family protein [Tritrichomonas foetus]